MGIGPVPATEKALRKAGLSIEDIGLFELNEAFAVQVLAFLDHFGIADDDPRVNQYGGAIAIGHPLASSGVRLMTQLARQFEEHPEVRYGLTAMCIGIGMGARRHLGEPPPRRLRPGGRGMSDTATTGRTPRPARRGRHPHPGARHRPARRRRHPGAGHPGQRLRPHQAQHLRPADHRRAAGHRGRAAASAPRPARSRPSASPASRSSSPSAPTSRPSPRRPARAGPRGRPAPATPRSRRSWTCRCRPSRSSTARPWAAAWRSPWRATTARSPPACPRVALPETFLGLVPGWGGCYLLPNLDRVRRTPSRSSSRTR